MNYLVKVRTTFTLQLIIRNYSRIRCESNKIPVTMKNVNTYPGETGGIKSTTMETTAVNCSPESAGNQLQLQRLVNALINMRLEILVKKQSFFVNDVQDWLPLKANKKVVTNVLDFLLRNVLHETSNSCIRITAKEYSQVILIHIDDMHERDYSTDSIISDQILVEAKKIGGIVEITRQQKNHTVIAFSFPNIPAAA